MFNSISDCKHINTVVDEREGSIICSDCALVTSEHLFLCSNVTSSFTQQYKTENYNVTSSLSQQYKTENEILEILERLNLSSTYAENVKKNMRKISIKRNNRSISNDVLAASIFKTFNSEKNTLSIGDVSAVSGVSKKKIAKLDKSIHILKSEHILEKYCCLNNLDYKNYTVIKEELYKYKVLGHNPLTLVGSLIYMHCKRNKIKNSMKNISQTLNISPISIQRFLKNELSYRC